MTPTVDFVLPSDLEATSPPEELGKRRDQVRLMVGRRSTGRITDDVFSMLPSYLKAGDVLVINTSRTLPAAVPGRTADGQSVMIHFSTLTSDGQWIVEVRTPAGFGTLPGPMLEPQRVDLPRDARVNLLARVPGSHRLWLSAVNVRGDLLTYLDENGGPIRYGYAAGPWPLQTYQTVYARQPGSAEMPSAGRPFTSDLLAALSAAGVAVVPVVLHAGVASIEVGEPPGTERFSVPPTTAAVVNTLRGTGGRVIAVGTTSTRALESAAAADGKVIPTDGHTDLVIGPDRPPRVVDGLVTGWHEPRATHLDLVETVAGPELTKRMYGRALSEGYRWHEFGDSCLILP
jgi:S-adenosylmethionine:tRNA ribosyltransferase-isomerase